MRFRRGHRLHRATSATIVATLVGSALAYGLADGLVERTESRLLEQQVGQGSLVLSSLLSSNALVADSVARSLQANGVDEQRFDAAAEGVGAPGGLSAVALIDLTDGQVLAQAGSPMRELTASTQDVREALGAERLALLPLERVTGTDRVALGLVAPASPTVAVYLELPMSTRAAEVPDLPGDAFTGVDFAVYLGQESTENLLLTNQDGLPLTGRRATAWVAPTLGETISLATSLGDPLDASLDADSAHEGHLLMVFSAQGSLVGTLAQLFPLMLLLLGLTAGSVVAVVLERSQRRRDRALDLVEQLEERNALIAEAAERQAVAESHLRRAQRMEAVGQLAGGVAHDFNNLLAVMFSYLGFLRQAGAGQPWLEDVEEVDAAAHRAAELTRQLLLFSRGETTDAQVVDVRALLQERQRLLARTLDESITVRVSLPDHEVSATLDPVELDQVLMNLAVNARDAMPCGGVLSLDLSADAETVCLEVTDNGAGMPPEVAERAVEPFFTTKEVGRGTGLGLATVYGIVTRAAGTLTIDSVPGEGTSIRILLPRCEPALQGVPTARAATEDGQDAVVLLVEDDDALRRASARVLTEAGYTVLESPHAAAALDVVTSRAVDLVVSDVVMPGGMSGIGLAERLRVLRPGLPVVLASGYSPQQPFCGGPVPDGITLLRKPFPGTALIDAVRDALRAPARI